MIEEIKENIITIVAVIVIILLMFVFSKVFESQTYNKLTGAETTWWDAMWVELSVQEGVK